MASRQLSYRSEGCQPNQSTSGSACFHLRTKSACLHGRGSQQFRSSSISCARPSNVSSPLTPFLHHSDLGFLELPQLWRCPSRSLMLNTFNTLLCTLVASIAVLVSVFILLNVWKANPSIMRPSVMTISWLSRKRFVSQPGDSGQDFHEFVILGGSCLASKILNGNTSFLHNTLPSFHRYTAPFLWCVALSHLLWRPRI